MMPKGGYVSGVMKERHVKDGKGILSETTLF
jgi:hypothetical protein